MDSSGSPIELDEDVLQSIFTPQQQGPILGLLPQDLLVDRFHTMQKASKELQAALKLSQKRSKQSDDELED